MVPGNRICNRRRKSAAAIHQQTSRYTNNNNTQLRESSYSPEDVWNQPKREIRLDSIPKQTKTLKNYLEYSMLSNTTQARSKTNWIGSSSPKISLVYPWHLKQQIWNYEIWNQTRISNETVTTVFSFLSFPSVFVFFLKFEFQFQIWKMRESWWGGIFGWKKKKRPLTRQMWCLL